MGIWEGSVLAQEAHSLGLETESYTIDAALAPRERDWVSAANVDVAELFFVSESLARASLSWLNAHLAEFYPGWRASDVVVEPGKDWNAEWRASFRGVEVPPDWWVVPPWESSALVAPGRVPLVLNPGAGLALVPTKPRVVSRSFGIGRTQGIKGLRFR